MCKQEWQQCLPHRIKLGTKVDNAHKSLSTVLDRSKPIEKMLTAIIRQMCFLLRMDLDLLCCSLENKWKQRAHTHCRLCMNNIASGHIWLGAPMKLPHYRAEAAFNPRAEHEAKAWVPVIYSGVLSQEKQVGDKRKNREEERANIRMHRWVGYCSMRLGAGSHGTI